MKNSFFKKEEPNRDIFTGFLHVLVGFIAAMSNYFQLPILSVILECILDMIDFFKEDVLHTKQA